MQTAIKTLIKFKEGIFGSSLNIGFLERDLVIEKTISYDWLYKAIKETPLYSFWIVLSSRVE